MPQRLLIVEDDAEIARVVRDTLVRGGYDVTWASTGREGWEDFQATGYDLVLVDLMLPELDGYALCQNIRWVSDVPVLVISAKNREQDIVAGLKAGADDCDQAVLAGGAASTHPSAAQLLRPLPPQRSMARGRHVAARAK